jgi:hypothetical protein
MDLSTLLLAGLLLWLTVQGVSLIALARRQAVLAARLGQLATQVEELAALVARWRPED